MLSVDRDRAVAKAAVRPVLAFYLAAVGSRSPLTAAYGYNEQLAELLARGGVETVAREMPDEWVDELTVSGDPDEVTARLDALLAAGATSVVLSPADNSTMVEQIELTANEVLPHLTSPS